MFPASVPRTDVGRLVEAGTAPVFARVDGFLSLTVSVGALMGPAAKSGDVGVVMSADFESLDAALAAIQSDDFRQVKEETEAIGARIYLYEVRELA